FTQSGGSNSSDSLYLNYGTYTQSGGTNSASNLFLDAVRGGAGRYNLQGGTLAVGDLQNQGGGTFDFTGSGTLSVTRIADLSVGTVIHPEQGTVTGGSTSLILLPAGADPGTYFASLTTSGVVHAVGTPLNLATGQSVIGT